MIKPREKDRPLRVLCVTPVGPEGMGGIDRLYFYMRQHLGASGGPIDWRFFASRGPSAGWKSLFTFPARLLRFVWIMLTGGIDVVHVNHSTGGSALRKWALVSIAKLFGKPVSTHFHGMILDRAYDERPLWLKAVRAISLKSDRIVILGDFFTHAFRDRLGIDPAKLTIIHNGIPDFAPDLTLPKPANAERFILFAGEVGPRKGAGLLLEALAILRQRAPGWRCVVAGNGDIPEYKAMAAMLGLQQKVSFTGWIAAHDMHQLMRSADIVVLPSRVEALPLSLIEGACAGAALVSSKAGASAEINREDRNGLIVPLESEALAAALAALVNDPARLARMQLESRKVFLESFRIEDFERALRSHLLAMPKTAAPVTTAARVA